MKTKPTQERYSKRQKNMIVVSLCLTSIFANSAYSSIAPFYPAEAQKKGVDSELIGIIFSGYSISMCLLSPLSAVLMNRYGRKPVMMAGCFFEVSCSFIFQRVWP